MDDGTQAFACGDGLESAHACPDDQDIDGLDHADCRKDLGGEVRQLIGCNQHALIACAGAHGGQGVHGLCPCNAGNAVQGDAGHALGSHMLDHLVVGRCGRVDKGNQGLSLMHHVHFMLIFFLVKKRFFDFKNDVRFFVNLTNIVHNRRARCHIVRIVVESTFSGIFFDQDSQAVLDHFCCRFGRRGHATLTRHDFLRDTDNHFCTSV